MSSREGNASYQKTTHNEIDRTIINSIKPIVDGIARMFGDNCEVVLHSLQDFSQSVIKITNGHITGRKTGSPVTDYVIEILNTAQSSENDVVGSYNTITKDGKVLRSVTVVIRNSRGSPIGLLCINLNLSQPLLNFMRDLLPGSSSTDLISPEFFPSDIDELVRRVLENTMKSLPHTDGTSPLQRSKAIVWSLYTKGIFNIRGAVDIVSKGMGISTSSMYNYIREAKQSVGGESRL